MYERLLQYLREVKQELKRVQWPNRKETMVSTGVVLGFVFFFAIYFWITDSIFFKVIHLIIN